MIPERTAASVLKHADLKPSNILLEVDDIETVPKRYLEKTSARTTELQDTGDDDKCVIPLSEVIQTPLISDMDNISLKIIDLGVGKFRQPSCRFSTLVADHHGQASWIHNHLTEDIQSPHLRAPEVTIGAPWSTDVDIWSLGCLVFLFTRLPTRHQLTHTGD